MAHCLVTGANGHLGRRLIRALAGTTQVTAVVRSETARERLAQHCPATANLAIVVRDPGDSTALAPLLQDVDHVVHLIGTIKSSTTNRLVDAHQRPATALTTALARHPVSQLVYVSIVGASTTSASACLRARAEVESILTRHAGRTSILRVPMVLGEGDRASRALARRARATRTLVFRGASLEQPLYAGDLIAAVRSLLQRPPVEHTTTELAGPESLTRCDLIARAAAVLGRPAPAMLSLPLACGMAFAAVMETISATPPITRDMLRILDHDDHIDSRAAAAALGLELTPLDDMLRACIAPRPTQS